MTTYYLISNSNLLAILDTTLADVVALPLLRTADGMSLLNKVHADNLMTNLDLTAAQALAALGLTDERASLINTVFLATRGVVGLQTRIDGPAYHMVDVGAYSLWNVHSNQANLLALHAELWAMAPVQTLGLLAVVQVFGTSFAVSAARTATGMTAAQALARRDRVAAYLESIGQTNTAALRAATTENTQMLAIVAALGYSTAQLWDAMVAG